MQRVSRHLQAFRPVFSRAAVLQIACGDSEEDRVVYCFQVCYTSHRWTIQRTWSQFRAFSKKLQQEQELYQLKDLPVLVDRGKFMAWTHEERLIALETYICLLGDKAEVCLLPVFLEFVEVSALSFDGTSGKHKEGYVWKKTGGRRANEERTCNCSKYFRRYQQRWLLIRDTTIGYMTSNTSEILHESLLFKGKFLVQTGKRDTGHADGITIVTSQRVLTFRTGSEVLMLEWQQAILTAYQASEWNQKENPYSSSFPVRKGNQAQWFVDGEDYFRAVYEDLIQAQREVCITDWWLSPEMYLMRSPLEHPQTQLVEVLGQLADRGVSVYVCIYKEVKFALTLNSIHTRDVLKARSPNIKVLRHPHRSVVGGEFLWSHHEKVVCIDQQVAFLGGLDLCFGRWDRASHPLFDSSPSLWPGIDYSNSRVCDFAAVENWTRDSVNRAQVPRMPWHDVGLRIVGKTASDIALHFIELWNHIMTDITGRYHRSKELLQPCTTDFDKSRFDHIVEVLVPPPSPDHPKSPFEIAASPEPDPHFRQRSRSLHIDSPRSPREKGRKTIGVACKHFNVALFANLQTGSEEEGRAVHIALSPVASELKHFVLSKLAGKAEEEGGNTLLRSNTAVLGTSTDETDKELQEIFNQYKGNDEVIRVRSEANRDRMEERDEELEKAEIMEKEAQDEEQFLRNLLKINQKAGIQSGNCDCQLLRSGGRWSLGLEDPETSIHTAYLHLIDSADHYIYIENQFFISSTAGRPVRNQVAQALVERIKVAAEKREQFRVIVVLPLLPAFEGSVDDSSAAVLRVELYWEYATISRGANSLLEQLKSDPNISDPGQYISFYGLRTHARASTGSPVTELVYVHSKLMIVDDETVLIGSANINDRSLIGSHDSEIAVFVRDLERFPSRIAGKAKEVSAFARSLRLKLWKEHTGVENEAILEDPLSESCEKAWKSTAAANTEFYRTVFRCYPDDQMEKISEIRTKAELAQAEMYDSEVPKGYLVRFRQTQFPLDFLARENLKLSVFNTEFYIPDENFV